MLTVVVETPCTVYVKSVFGKSQKKSSRKRIVNSYFVKKNLVKHFLPRTFVNL